MENRKIKDMAAGSGPGRVKERNGEVGTTIGRGGWSRVCQCLRAVDYKCTGCLLIIYDKEQ